MKLHDFGLTIFVIVVFLAVGFGLALTHMP